MDQPSRLLLLFLAATTAGWLRAQQIIVPDTAVNPLAGNPAAAEDGRRLFSVTCQICHGADGQGDRDRGGAVLNRAGLKHGDKDADILRVLRNGVPGTQMPTSPTRGGSDRRICDRRFWRRTPRRPRRRRGCIFKAAAELRLRSR